MATIAERVHQGALLLDTEIPDWFRQINLATLDISSTDDCIVAQLFDGYSDGIDALLGEWGSDEASESHGFESERDTDGDVGRPEYVALTQAWGDEIRARRAV